MGLFSTIDTLSSSGKVGFMLYIDDRSASSFSDCLQAAITPASAANFAFSCQDTQAGGSLSIQDNIEPQTWHCACVRYERIDATQGTLKLYVDGVSQGTDTSTASRDANSTSDAHIGSFNSTQYFTGSIGRVICYKSLMSDTDVHRISSALLR